MTPETLWNRYAATWSLQLAQREAELTACVDEDVTYCDPNGLLIGRSALSDYMGQFQVSVPGGHFRIRKVLCHHERSMADWRLQGKDGGVLQTGSSFGKLTEDGRLSAISGFFRPEDPDGPA